MGRKLTQETRRNISEALRRFYEYNPHHSVTEETRRKLSEKKRRFLKHNPHPRGMLGKKHKLETLKKLRGRTPWNKGKTYEELCGKKRAKELKEKMGLARAQKSLEQAGLLIEKLYGVRIGKLKASYGSIRDLRFAREVLVLKTKRYSYIENNGLREIRFGQPILEIES